MSRHSSDFQRSIFISKKLDKQADNVDIVGEILSWKPKFPVNRFQSESELEKDIRSSVGSKLRNARVEALFSNRRKVYANENG